MPAEDLSFSLEIYEGPLDLLLSLVHKNKVNIYDIPISLIFDQYMEYIYNMQKTDLDVAAEFIDMASKLMLIKSKMLLPRQVIDGKEVDPRTPLVNAILELQKAKDRAKELSTRYAEFSGRFIKETDEVGPDRSFVTDHDVELLIKAFERITTRQKEISLSKNEQSKKTLDTILNKRVTPVSEKLFGVLRYLFRNGETRFEDLLFNTRIRSDVVASFVAILQLIRSGRISIVRETEDGDLIMDINRKVRAAHE